MLAVGLTDGGYYGRAATALALASAAVAVLGALHGGSARLTRAGLTVLAALVLLACWIALSATWAVPGALVEGEVRRAVVYASALAAVLLAVVRPRREPLLMGLVGGISLLGAVVIAMQASSGEVVDRFYGTLLTEPVGNPNALGVLAALGITLAIGLVDGREARDRALGRRRETRPARAGGTSRQTPIPSASTAPRLPLSPSTRTRSAAEPGSFRPSPEGLGIDPARDGPAGLPQCGGLPGRRHGLRLTVRRCLDVEPLDDSRRGLDLAPWRDRRDT